MAIIINVKRYSKIQQKRDSCVKLVMLLQPLFNVNLAGKDSKHALNLVKVSGTTIKAVDVPDNYWAAGQKHMGLKCDIAGIYEHQDRKPVICSRIEPQPTAS